MDAARFESFLADWRSLGELATFTPNRTLPVHNWFYYKEGFARDLVWRLLDRFKVESRQSVLDPFCGSGTTLLACAERGIPSIGLDVQPVALLASSVKTAAYDLAGLRERADQLLQSRFLRVSGPVLPIMKAAFSPHNLADVLFWKKQVEAVADPAERNFFQLALISAALKGSWLFKDGAVLKVKKRPVAPVKILFRRTVRKWIKELEERKLLAGAEVRDGDARRIPLADGSIAAAITSPPYLNNIDYTKVYSVENWFLGDSGPALRSWIGMEGEEMKELAGMNLPPAAHAYFQDMKKVLEELHRVLVPGGRAGIVLANAYFAPLQQHVDVDFILAALAENIGFSCEEIGVLQERHALEHRTIQKGPIRESCIVLKR